MVKPMVYKIGAHIPTKAHRRYSLGMQAGYIS